MCEANITKLFSYVEGETPTGQVGYKVKGEGPHVGLVNEKLQQMQIFLLESMGSHHLPYQADAPVKKPDTKNLRWQGAFN